MGEAMAVAEATVQDLQTLAAQMRQLRDTIVVQHATIQATIAAQQEQLARLEAAHAQQTHPGVPSDVESQAGDAPARAPQGSVRRARHANRSGASSRRALLKGAGVAPRGGVGRVVA